MAFKSLTFAINDGIPICLEECIISTSLDACYRVCTNVSEWLCPKLCQSAKLRSLNSVRFHNKLKSSFSDINFAAYLLPWQLHPLIGTNVYNTVYILMTSCARAYVCVSVCETSCSRIIMRFVEFGIQFVIRQTDAGTYEKEVRRK